MAWITATAGRQSLEEEEPATWTRDILEGGRDELFNGIRGHKAQAKRQRTRQVSPLRLVGHVLRKSLQLGQETCLNEQEMTSSKA